MSAVYVLYGSQTGNSEMIAETVAEEIKATGLPVECFPLNKVKKEKLVLKEIAQALVVVVSTTGNGDAPENCEAFWRSIKLRSAAKDMFEGLPYTVMALGDTNYDKFCHMGKVIDKRVNELGGSRFMDLECADEGTGNMEETVDAWKTKLVPVLEKLLKYGASLENTLESKTDSDATIDTNTKPEEKKEAKEEVIVTPYPKGIIKLSEIADKLNMTTTIQSDPDVHSLPRVPSSMKSLSIIDTLNESVIAPDNQEWTCEKPFMATPESARWLTTPQGLSWDEEKKVIELTLNISGSGIEYNPGDSIGISCPNRKELIDVVLSRLNENPSEATSGSSSAVLTLNTFVSIQNMGTCTLGNLLEYRIDLSVIPKKACVIALANCCTDENEKRQLLWLTSKDINAKKLWTSFIEEQVIGVGELLALYPSCKPNLSTLASVSPPMAPRYYSVASSPMKNKDLIAIGFSVVRYCCGSKIIDNSRIEREGLCTTYLERMLLPMLENNTGEIPVSVFQLAPELKIRLFHKASLDFRLPASVTVPTIMIGPGTGVAPFVGFLQHRYAMEKERVKGSSNAVCEGIWRGSTVMSDLPNESVSSVDEFIRNQKPGPMWLFFGCRNEKDYLYRSNLQSFVQSGTLNTLEVALSRKTEEKVYVQHRLKSRAAEVSDLILKDNASVFICGDGNAMAKDVMNAIKEILSNQGGLGDEKAAALIDELKLRRRLVLDIWS